MIDVFRNATISTFFCAFFGREMLNVLINWEQ
jgi:hypothetical protein